LIDHIHNDLGVLGRLVGIGDAGEALDLAAARFGVSKLSVSSY